MMDPNNPYSRQIDLALSSYQEAPEEAGKSQIGKTPTNSQFLSLISKLSIITGLLQDRVDELEYRIKLLTTRF
jgi:hypothetical protein